LVGVPGEAPNNDEFCILPFGWSRGVWILCTDVSELSVSSTFIGGVSRKNLLTDHRV
jgi:hypothetical protein